MGGLLGIANQSPGLPYSPEINFTAENSLCLLTKYYRRAKNTTRVLGITSVERARLNGQVSVDHRQ